MNAATASSTAAAAAATNGVCISVHVLCDGRVATSYNNNNNNNNNYYYYYYYSVSVM